MPKKRVIKKKESENNVFDVQKLMKSADSYKSLIYGIVTVIVLFLVIALGVKTLVDNKAQIDNEAAITQSTPAPDNRYTVEAGETLWSIAQKTYNDGSMWHEIASANKLTDPTTLEKGTKLILPKLTPTIGMTMEPTNIPSTPTPAENIQKETGVGLSQSTGEKITGTTYTVVRGDYLWEIAIRAYGDGYRWTDIAKANSLSNPNLIFSGNVLKLPRP